MTDDEDNDADNVAIDSDESAKTPIKSLVDDAFLINKTATDTLNPEERLFLRRIFRRRRVFFPRFFDEEGNAEDENGQWPVQGCRAQAGKRTVEYSDRQRSRPLVRHENRHAGCRSGSHKTVYSQADNLQTFKSIKHFSPGLQSGRHAFVQADR